MGSESLSHLKLSQLEQPRLENVHVYKYKEITSIYVIYMFGLHFYFKSRTGIHVMLESGDGWCVNLFVPTRLELGTSQIS